MKWWQHMCVFIHPVRDMQVVSLVGMTLPSIWSWKITPLTTKRVRPNSLSGPLVRPFWIVILECSGIHNDATVFEFFQFAKLFFSHHGNKSDVLTGCRVCGVTCLFTSSITTLSDAESRIVQDQILECCELKIKFSLSSTALHCWAGRSQVKHAGPVQTDWEHCVGLCARPSHFLAEHRQWFRPEAAYLSCAASWSLLSQCSGCLDITWLGVRVLC